MPTTSLGVGFGLLTDLQGFFISVTSRTMTTPTTARRRVGRIRRRGGRQRGRGGGHRGRKNLSGEGS